MIAFGRAIASRTHRRVVMACCAQSGKSETLLDVMGQRLDEVPAPIIYVGPSKQFVTERFEPRVMDLLDQAPALAEKVARGKRMSKTRKLIAGVPLILAHAGSSTALKSDPFALACTDEADELMANVKGQGNPITLIDRRGDTYADFVHAIVSTPSEGPNEVETDELTGLQFWKAQPPEEVDSAIWKLWQQGTRHHWTWRCPGCRKRFVPRFSCLKWPDHVEVVTSDGEVVKRKLTVAEVRDLAFVECPRCERRIGDRDKVRLNETGAYVAPGQRLSAGGEVLGQPAANDTISFWVSGLASPFKTFGERAAEFVAAARSGDPAQVQTVVNGGFGELWAPAGGDAPEWMEVAERRLPYRFRDVPDGVLFITAGIDVQKDRLVYVLRGWGVRQESWLIEHGELFGEHHDTRLDDVWAELAHLLETDFGGLPVRRAFIDSGFRPGKPGAGDENKVYAFARRHARQVLATKGYDGRSAPISVSRIDVTPTGTRAKYGLDLVRLDSDALKSWVHSRIRWPADEPGGWHIPLDASEDYCRQVVSEARVRKANGRATWTKRSPHNHYLDAEALAYGAAKMLGLERIADTASRKRTESQITDVPPALPGVLRQRGQRSVIRSRFMR
jgi:phage terminase large subunit GpA-like protein